MASNKRIFYAVQRAGIAPLGSTSYTTIRGLQTIGMTTTFNLEQAFEIGQLSIYENVENIPDVEVTTEKVLDGYCPVYLLATQQGTSASLTGRSNARCSLALSIYEDTVNSASGSGVYACELSGLYVSAVSYTFPTEGNCTESLTLVGNNKVWKAGSSITFADNPFATNGDTPLTGVMRRQNVQFGSAGTKLPSEVPGISSSGYNELEAGGGAYKAHISNISVSTDLGREELYELGRRGPYHRFVSFPTEVTTEITTIASSGDGISATEDGLYGGAGTCAINYNLTAHAIYIRLCDGLKIDVGSQNKLASVGVTGGDAGGGNVEVTYTYSNFNDMIVYHPQDPNYASAPFRP